MVRFIITLLCVFSSICVAAHSLTDIRDWKVKNGILKARVIYLSSDNLKVYYAEADGIIKEASIDIFDDLAKQTIKQLDRENKQPYAMPTSKLAGDHRRSRSKSATGSKIWPPLVSKGWQIKNWNVARNDLRAANPKDYGKDEDQTQLNIGAALWWHGNFTFRHEKLKSLEKLHKSFYKKFKRVETATTSDFVPEGMQANVLLNHRRVDKPEDIAQFIGGSCVTAILLHPTYDNRRYREDYYLIKKANKKGFYHLYYHGEILTGSFQPVEKKNKIDKEKAEDAFEFIHENPDSLSQWFKDEKITFQYDVSRCIIKTMIPVEKQAVGVKWQAHPAAAEIKKSVKPKKKDIADSVMLPDNDVKFLNLQRPLKMQLKSIKGQSLIATVHKFNENLVTIKRRNTNHTFKLDTLDFSSQMKLKFWKANQGLKLKLPPCVLHYKVRNQKRGYAYTFRISYDGESRCYLASNKSDQEVYFNAEDLTYSIYRSKRGRLLLEKKDDYRPEDKLNYAKQDRFGEIRRNYITTSASETNGFANRILLSKNSATTRNKTVTHIKAAHVEAQPVVQFMCGFKSINVPAAQQIGRLNYHLRSTMRLLYQNGNLPLELHWKQTVMHYGAGNSNLNNKENMELTLEDITPLEENFFHQFEKLEAAEKVKEAERKKQEQK